MPDKLDKYLLWGGVGSLSLSGAFLGLSTWNVGEARALASLPVIQSLADLSRLGQGNGSLKPGMRVVARGRVSTPRPIEAPLSGKTAVAARVTEHELIRRRAGCSRWLQVGDWFLWSDGWCSDSKLVKATDYTEPLHLKLHNGRLHLKPDNQLDAHQVFEHTVSRSRPAKDDLMVRAVGTTLGYIVTGYLEQEWILPIDTELTAIGTLAYNDSSHKEMAIEPLAGKVALSRRTIPEQIRVLMRWSNGLRWAAYGCSALGGAMMGIYLARRLIKAWDKRRMRMHEREFLRAAEEARRQAILRAAPAAGQADVQAGASGQALEAAAPQEWHCIVCWNTDVPQTVFPACGHVAVCRNCSPHMLRCPICRQDSRPRLLYFS